MCLGRGGGRQSFWRHVVLRDFVDPGHSLIVSCDVAWLTPRALSVLLEVSFIYALKPCHPRGLVQHVCLCDGSRGANRWLQFLF